MSLLNSIQQAQPTLKRLLQQREDEIKSNKTTKADVLDHPLRLAVGGPLAEASISTRSSARPTRPSENKQHQKHPIIPAAAPNAFYSSRRIQHVEARIAHFLANVQRRVDGSRPQDTRPTHWQTFPTQQAAFDYADKHDPDGEWLRIWSLEYNEAGKRKFLVTSYATFWTRYCTMLPMERHYYEIIRQGTPCHLYLDLEYKVEDNRDRDGVAAVDATLSLLKDVYLEQFGITLQDDWIIELDSSSNTKFSRHVIVHVPGRAFFNNLHVGALVLELCERVKREASIDPRCQHVLVKKANDADTLFIDSGVYSRNRAFRLHLSKKAGKDTPLVPTGRFGTADKPQQEVFFSSLVCNVPPGVELWTCFEEGAQEQQQGNVTRRIAQHGMKRSATSTLALSYCASPYSALDTFIESVCSQAGGSPGRIRSWAALDDDLSLMLYNINGNRYCGNIGREHRSNGIFLVVDLQQGAWWQKCYDPECRQYRSPVMPLPIDLMVAPKQPEQAQQGPQEQGDVPLQDCKDAIDWELGQPELMAVQEMEEEYYAKRQQKELEKFLTL